MRRLTTFLTTVPLRVVDPIRRTAHYRIYTDLHSAAITPPKAMRRNHVNRNEIPVRADTSIDRLQLLLAIESCARTSTTISVNSRQAVITAAQVRTALAGNGRHAVFGVFRTELRHLGTNHITGRPFRAATAGVPVAADVRHPILGTYPERSSPVLAPATP